MPPMKEVKTDHLSSADTVELFKRYVIGNYNRYPVNLVRGSGSWVWDAEGNRYLDFFPGWGCGLLGHCPPRVVQAGQGQGAAPLYRPNTGYTQPPAPPAPAPGGRPPVGGMAVLCNRGT